MGGVINTCDGPSSRKDARILAEFRAASLQFWPRYAIIASSSRLNPPKGSVGLSLCYENEIDLGTETIVPALHPIG